MQHLELKAGPKGDVFGPKYLYNKYTGTLPPRTPQYMVYGNLKNLSKKFINKSRHFSTWIWPAVAAERWVKRRSECSSGMAPACPRFLSTGLSY
jgi:hypothetical protein